jgi:SAM-dependent methyltransferase
MERRDILLTGIRKDMLGVEIGPWHNPLVPKSDGYRSLSLDVFDTEALRRIAAKSPSVSKDSVAQIEDVDLVGSASDLGGIIEAKGLTGQLDYIVSSHNFEHLPDPIRFLQGAERALKPGGILSMALPDKRGCFDYFRPHSTTADFIAAYHEGRKRPSNAQILAMQTLYSRRVVDGQEVETWNFTEGPDEVCPMVDVQVAYDRFLAFEASNASDYPDVHCWVFTPASFEIIARDIHQLGIAKVGVEQIQGPNVFEFYVRMVNGLPTPAGEKYYVSRLELLRSVSHECAVSASSELAKLRAKMGALDAEMTATRAEISGLLASTSWRITAPLRKLRTALDRLVGTTKQPSNPSERRVRNNSQ